MSTIEIVETVSLVWIALNVTYISLRLSPLARGTRWPPVGEAKAGNMPKTSPSRTVSDQLEYMACAMNFMVESELARKEKEDA